MVGTKGATTAAGELGIFFEKRSKVGQQGEPVRIHSISAPFGGANASYTTWFGIVRDVKTCLADVR